MQNCNCEKWFAAGKTVSISPTQFQGISMQEEKSRDRVIAGGIATDKGFAQAIPCGTHGSNPETAIQVVKDGDHVQSIIIRCACGEVTQVMCKYD